VKIALQSRPPQGNLLTHPGQRVPHRPSSEYQWPRAARSDFEWGDPVAGKNLGPSSTAVAPQLPASTNLNKITSLPRPLIHAAPPSPPCTWIFPPLSAIISCWHLSPSTGARHPTRPVGEC